jgi:hypothetical protein
MQHFQQRQRRAGANRQQQDGNEKFDPLRHARMLAADFADCTDFQKSPRPNIGGNQRHLRINLKLKT